MILYLDTNVLLARYSRREPGHPDAKRLMTSMEAGNVDAVTSVLTLVEIVSATSRAYVTRLNNIALPTNTWWANGRG